MVRPCASPTCKTRHCGDCHATRLAYPGEHRTTRRFASRSRCRAHSNVRRRSQMPFVRCRRARQSPRPGRFEQRLVRLRPPTRGGPRDAVPHLSSNPKAYTSPRIRSALRARTRACARGERGRGGCGWEDEYANAYTPRIIYSMGKSARIQQRVNNNGACLRARCRRNKKQKKREPTKRSLLSRRWGCERGMRETSKRRRKECSMRCDASSARRSGMVACKSAGVVAKRGSRGRTGKPPREVQKNLLFCEVGADVEMS